jgi:predicted dehydrogenase
MLGCVHRIRKPVHIMKQPELEIPVGNPVGVGVIGAGNVLWAYLQVLDRLVPRGLAWEGPICARQRDAWPELLARRPHARLVAGVEEVLDSDVAVVVIITPPSVHAEVTRAALEAGKHVVCEKPVAMSHDEAAPIFELARSRGLNLLAAPFVQLSPTLRELWTRIADGQIGEVHTARGLYGNPGSDWATWFHTGGVGPLAEAGVYNLKSLTALLGPVDEVYAAETTAVARREAAGETIEHPDPDVSQLVVRHTGGALSTITSGQAIQRYRRPALELYGTEGTANLLGDDWDPAGFEIWRNADGCWATYEPLDATWLWADGLREAVTALVEGRPPLVHHDHDLHLLDVIDQARVSARERRSMPVRSRHEPPDLRLVLDTARHHLHDHTRPFDEQ